MSMTEVEVQDGARPGSTGSCTDCGAHVTWARNDFGHSVALVSTGTAQVIDPATGTSYHTKTYRSHECSQADLDSYPTRPRTKDWSKDWSDAEAARESCALVPCSKCGAEPGTGCSNLSSRKRNIESPTAWPHQERMKDAYAYIMRLRRRMTPDEVHDEATRWSCPTCQVQRGERCHEVLPEGSTKEPGVLKFPHGTRNPRDVFIAHHSRRVDMARAALRKG